MTTTPFNWRLPLYGLAGAILLLLPSILFGNDIAIFLLSVGLALTLSLIILAIFFVKLRRQPLAALVMLVIFGSLSWLLIKPSENAHRTLRWLALSSRYKAAVLAQPTPANGQLKRVEWETWGFTGGGDTTEYLVFDPADSLAPPSPSSSPAKPAGIPCKVSLVRRMSADWYIVRFYTGTSWEDCGPASPGE